MLNSQFKDRLHRFLENQPLLRVLFLDPRFVALFSILLVIMLTAVIILPKVWRVSPPGFKPVVKISGLDMIQAWSLHRSALKFEAQGKQREAILAWERAVGNNPCDLELARGNLRAITNGDKLNEFRRAALGQALWLLRLSSTNMADVELTAQLCRTSRAPQLLAAVLEPLQDRMTPFLRVAWTKTAFDTARWEDVAKEIKKGGLPKDDEELNLYIAAWQSTFGQPAESGPAKEYLQKKLNDPQWQVLAHRVSLVSLASRDDLQEYYHALKQLELWKEDRFGDHLRYWQMLLGASRKEEAVELMKQYPQPLDSMGDLIAMVELAAGLKEREFGIGQCRKYQSNYQSLPSFWLLYASQIMETKEPDRMRAVLAEIRSTPGVRDELEGLGHFFEARMEQFQNHFSQAEALFEKAASTEYRDDNLAARIADEMLRLGRMKEAGKMYQGLEQSMGKNIGYWVNVMRVADQIKNLDLMYRAAERGYGLKTNDVSMMNYFVAASLLKKTNVAEVDRLTLTLISLAPDAPASKVNRGAALLLNKRPAEALALLQAVDVTQFNRSEQSFYRLDLLNALIANNRWADAKKTEPLIEDGVLFPEQATELKSIRTELEKH